MLSDEEKKSIDIIKTLIQYLNVWKENYTIVPKDVKYLDIVLNLIEKQSKEIESLKEDKEIIKRKYEDLVDENEKFLYDSAVYLMGKDDTDSKWEDKIKAKIEEIDIEIQCCEYADDDTEEYKQDIEKEKRRLLRDKAVLQSLLEKE